MPKPQPLEVRFSKYLGTPTATGCVPWTGRTVGRGYGQIDSGGGKGRGLLSHRVAYELAYGAIPDGQLVLHKCDNPPCCNPEHLFLGTHSDNVADMYSKRRGIHGERAPHARLTESLVLDIRAKHAAGAKQNALAAEYGVSTTAMNSVILRRSWRHI